MIHVEKVFKHTLPSCVALLLYSHGYLKDYKLPNTSVINRFIQNQSKFIELYLIVLYKMI